MAVRKWQAVLVWAVLSASCSSGQEGRRERLAETIEMDGAPMAKRDAGPRPSAPATADAYALKDAASNRAKAKPEPEPAPEPSRQKRLVYYNGYGKLRVTTPQETLEAAVAIAEEAGGYVERFTANRVVLRVPVAQFRALFARMLELGELLEKSVTAQDITDAFTATELRLKTLRASRDRLIELLAKAKNEQEKLTLLREIKRLTEQVDQLEMRLETLATLASFSRITVEAEPKQTDPYARETEWVAAFRWIRSLSPFRHDVAHQESHLELTLPKESGFVSLDDYEHWLAESADGAQIWAHERHNDPLGDDAFWLSALRERLASAYGKAETKTVGEFEVLRLVDDGPEGYRYIIAVNSDGDDLQVVEAYFPSAEHEARYGDAVNAVLEQGGS